MLMENIYSQSEIRRILEENSLAPLKSLGQNFLTDQNVVENIAEAAVSTKNVLEIGPGLGALTRKLADRAEKVVCVEIDRGMVEALSHTLKGYENVTVIHQDFLKTDLDEIRQSHFDGEDFAVVGNLPYYITSKILLKVLEDSEHVTSFTAMIQSEVADRLCAEPGDENYGAITASLAYYGGPEHLFDVSNKCFYPEPEVSSTVIRYVPRKMFDIDRDKYSKTVRGMFSMRRKNLQNNLKASFGIKGDRARTVFQEAGIDGSERAENLSPKDFFILAKAIYNI
ncbi:MAG: ribosomal RNA small subunit methyltransferase A [Clostridia bacterium]|nr:ribosomal RNA small subunit methyltransferase A [Clostridia bacterium]